MQPSDFTHLQAHLALLLEQYDFSLPQMPQIELQLDLSRFEAEWKKLSSNIPEPWKLETNGLEFTIGEKITSEGLTAKHPVVLIPGVISTVSITPISPTLLLSPTTGPRVLVHGARVSTSLPTKGLGRLLHALASHVQQGKVDGRCHARPGYRPRPPRS